MSFRSFRLFAFLFFVLPGRVPAADQELSPDQIASHKDQEEILQEADSIFAEVSRLSGLAIKSPVAKKFENKAFFRDYYTRQLEQQYPPAKKAAYEKAYMILGFLPPGGDIIRSYLDSFLKVVQGLYDPKTKTLYLADWIDWQDQENTLAHELTHALQDQHFDLTGFLAQGEGLSMDEQFARSSIMEGQAVAIALNLSLEDRGTDFTRVVNIAEWVGLNNYLSASGQKAFGHRVFLNEAINFPYVQGATFLQNYVRAYGWKGMEALFRHPPRSTRQILHPSEFFPKRHNPIRIQLGDLSAGPLPGYTRIWEDSFGEYGLTTLLAQEVGEKEAQRAAAGWRGDRFQVYEKRPSGLLLSGYILFAGEDEAEGFFGECRDFLNKKYRIEQVRRTDETIHWATLKGGDAEVYLERFGKRVVLIIGSAPNQTARIRGELWDIRSE